MNAQVDECVMLEICQLLMTRAFLKPGTVIANDIDLSLPPRHRRGKLIRSLSDAGHWFEYCTMRHFKRTPIEALSAGLCKLILAAPRFHEPIYRRKRQSEIFATQYRFTATMVEIVEAPQSLAALAASENGLKLIRTILIQDVVYSASLLPAVELLQRLLLERIPIRQLFGEPLSLYVGDDDIPDVDRKTMSLAEFWMSLRPHGSPKGWTHVDRSKNF